MRNLNPSTVVGATALCIVMTGGGSGRADDGPAPTAAKVLRRLRPGHPRLLLTKEDLARLQAAIGSDPTAKGWLDEVRKQGDRMLGEPPVVHELIGPRLLQQSRACLVRVVTLGLLHRLTGEAKYADRAVREMLAAAAFPDWNPSHFLDTAEMTNALGIGYDWLFDRLSAKDRAAVRTAIVEKGLKPAEQAVRKGRGWARMTNNWSQVCYGGITTGALAVADEVPEPAAGLVAAAIPGVAPAMATYEPDGGCEEGPGYWNYATFYAAFLLDALESALGTDFGVGRSDGWARIGDFHLNSFGPTGRAFNYSDAHEGHGADAQLLFFARRQARPDWARHERATGQPGAFHLLWLDPAGPPARPPAPAPLDAVFRRIHVAFFRGAWEDPAATYVGFKGGDNKASHGHLDLGTFVIDALGERWASDLGPDDYNLPGYFGGQRWDYYRMRTESHNTITFGNANQGIDAKAPITAFRTGPDRSHAVADLSTAYRGRAGKVLRGVALLGRRDVLVQDEVTDATEAWTWGLTTDADVELHGREAFLVRNGKRLLVRILEPADAVFAAGSAAQSPPQQTNEGFRRLTATRPPARGTSRLAVWFTPAGEKTVPPEAPAIRGLDRWVAEGGGR